MVKVLSENMEKVKKLSKKGRRKNTHNNEKIDMVFNSVSGKKMFTMVSNNDGTFSAIYKDDIIGEKVNIIPIDRWDKYLEKKYCMGYKEVK